jgi:opacity protein-like surface antigen
MKRLVGLTALSLILMGGVALGAVGYPATEEISYFYQGAGARAFGMGDAFIGISNDISGGTWNPAGIWVIETPTVSASYKMFVPDGKYTHNLTPVVTKSSLDMNSIGQFSFAAPVRIKGHGYVLNFNFNHNNESIIEEQFYSGFLALLYPDATNQLNPDASSKDESFLRTYNLGFSTRIYKQLSFGATANIYDGRRTKTAVYQGSWTDTVSVIDQLFDHQYRRITTIDSTTSNGFNLIFGLMYKMEKMNVGAVVRTPFQMKNNTDYSLFQVATTNGLPNIILSDTTYVQDSIAKQDMPLSIGVGVGFFPTQNLTLAADIAYYRFGSTNWYYRDSTFFSASGVRTDYFTKIPIDWNNTVGIGIGAEYLVNTPYGQIPLRAGVRFDQLPQPKDFETHTAMEIVDNDTLMVTAITAKDRQNMMSLSLGTGVRWSQINLDVAYRFSTGAEEKIADFFYNTPISSQKLERKAHEVRFTFTGFF